MPSQRALPEHKTPPGTRCISLTIPDDDEWEQQLYSEANRLAVWHFWRFDEAHSGTIVARRWRKAFKTWRHCQKVIQISGGADGDENMIRQNPANPCELQTSINGTDWCTFADFSLCFANPNQPGDGAPQPARGGGQDCYFGQMSAINRYLVPVPVNTGDVLDLQDAIGAGNDGTLSPWFCPTGETYFAGACIVGTGGPSGTDPLPSANHMRLIWKIGGSYYDAMGGPFTVPGGVVNIQPELQVNDSDITDNSGSYHFKVCVTNNALGAWSHTFDFTVDNGGFAAIVPVDTIPRAVYVPGVGWQSNYVAPGDTNELRIITPTLPSSTYQFASGQYTATHALNAGYFGTGTDTSADIQIHLSPLSSGTAVNTTGSAPNFTGTRVRFDLTEVTGLGVLAFTLSKMTITGVGVNPFI
jgi:hypothetical protein